MLHEPEYKHGTYFNEDLGVFAGWVCHRGSYADCMPIYSEEEDIVLLFSGENYPDPTVIDHLKQRGHIFDQKSANSIVHLYQEKGEDFVSLLNGWYSGILIDIRNSKIIIFNDRYGMGRIYYHENKEEFIFSTQAKSLLKIRPELRQMDLKSLGEYYTCGCVLENRTLFPKINIMPGGSVWSFGKNRQSKKTSFFSPKDYETQPALGNEDFYCKLRDTLKDIVPKYYESKDGIALSLTGGLDTRIILAFGKDLQAGEFPFYTFGGLYRDSYDVRKSREIANALKQDHTVLTAGKEFLREFPSYAEKTINISDGCIDVSGSTELYVNNLARDVAPVRLTGNYGSEVLRGVRSFKVNPLCQSIFHPEFLTYVRTATESFPKVMGGHHLTSAVFKQAPWFGYGRFAIEQSQLTVRTPYLDNAVVNLMYLAPPELTRTNEISLRLIAEKNPILFKIRTDRGLGGSPGNIFGLLSRYYLELLFKAEYFYNYGMPQWLSKIDYLLRPLQLEKLFLGRHKFHHYRVWFRDELSTYIREILLDKRSAERTYLNNKCLSKIVDGHTKGIANYTNEIDKLVSVELIYRHLLEQ